MQTEAKYLSIATSLVKIPQEGLIYQREICFFPFLPLTNYYLVPSEAAIFAASYLVFAFASGRCQIFIPRFGRSSTQFWWKVGGTRVSNLALTCPEPALYWIFFQVDEKTQN